MKKIEWLTGEQVQRAAKRGRKAALLCSIKHWEQLSSADKEQILGISGNCITCSFCALCTKYDFKRRQSLACESCGLYCLQSTLKRLGVWHRAATAFRGFKDHNYPLVWVKWKRVSKALLRRIIKLYKKEYGEVV